MCFLYWLFMFYLRYCNGQYCTDKPGTTLTFVSLPVKYTGCNDSTTAPIVTASQLDCSRTCLGEGNCVAFSYNKTSGLCSVCSDYSVKSLVVDTGPSETFYGLRQNIQYVELSSTTNIYNQLDLPCGLRVGNLIVLRGVYSNYAGFTLRIHQNTKNLVIHFSPREWYTTVNHFINGKWGSGDLLNITFKVGQKFVLHILARVDSYVILLNGKIIDTYSYVLPLSVVRFITVSGNIQYLQLSV